MKKPRMPSETWVSLLWEQYNKLSEPLKESFVNLAQSLIKEAESQNPNKITNEIFEGEPLNKYL